MRISIQACIERAGEQPSKVIEVAVIERNADVAPASGLGLFIRESQEILRQLQTVVLTEQVDQFIRITGRCQLCGGRLASRTQNPWSIAPLLARRGCEARAFTLTAAHAVTASRRSYSLLVSGPRPRSQSSVMAAMILVLRASCHRQRPTCWTGITLACDSRTSPLHSEVCVALMHTRRTGCVNACSKRNGCCGKVSRSGAWRGRSRCDGTQVGLALAIH